MTSPSPDYGVRLRPLLAAMLALGGCATTSLTGGAGERWQKASDGSPPSLGETSDCRVQATSYAAARYPDQVIRNADGSTYTFRYSNPDRFAAEIRFYESCLQAKGYVRPTASPSPPRPAGGA